MEEINLEIERQTPLQSYQNSNHKQDLKTKQEILKKDKSKEKFILFKQNLRSTSLKSLDISSNFYRESISDHDITRKSIQSYSVRSIYPPVSWPSSGRLSKDSDVYPMYSTSDYEINKKSNDANISLEEISELDIKAITCSFDSEYGTSDTLNVSMCNDNISEEIDETIERQEKTDNILEEVVINTNKNCDFEGNSSEQLFEGLEALEDFTWLKDISDIILPIEDGFRKQICFTETLIVSQEILSDEQTKANIEQSTEKEQFIVNKDEILKIGELKLSIESDSDNFLTFCQSNFSYKNGVGGSKLLATTDMNLKVIEDKKTEWHLTINDNIEKTLHVVREENNFIAFRTITKNKNVERYRKNVVLDTTNDYILDGALFVLMRYLILTAFTGKLKLWTMDISGDLCKCFLNIGKRKIFNIYKEPCETIRIKKILLNENNILVNISSTYFLTSGHIVRHKCKESRIFFHMNPSCTVIPPPPYPSNLEEEWENDVILFSKYLDLKAQNRSEIETYLSDHPEIKNILKDFVLATLLRKPSDILDFAIDYFLATCGGVKDSQIKFF